MEEKKTMETKATEQDPMGETGKGSARDERPGTESLQTELGRTPKGIRETIRDRIETVTRSRPVTDQEQTSDDLDNSDEKREGGKGQVRHTVRFDRDVHQILSATAKAEGISLNDAINLSVRRLDSYPKDLVELHSQIEYAISQLELVASLLEISQRNEETIIRCIETGQVDNLIRKLRRIEDDTFNLETQADGYGDQER
jgi:hypothetical protein